MKFKKVLVYNLRISMKKDNPIPKNIKTDNLRETVICAGQCYPL